MIPTAPIISEVIPVPNKTIDSTPEYTFSSNESGRITYGGSCSSASISAAGENNTVTFNALENGTYSNCTIIVTDASGNASNSLSVSTFTIESVSSPVSEEKNLYRFWSENFKRHFYTASIAERDKTINDSNWIYEGLVGSTVAKDSSNAKPVYHFWSENYKHHFFYSIRS